MNSPYALDKSNATLLGVCAGFANWADVDPLLVRVTLVLITLFLGPVAILAYLLTAFLAGQR
jgi:phage shock protein C